MSDSESSQQIEAKTEQKMEAELKNLLEKGRTITPFYDEETLLHIYKDCFQTENVFLNRLQMIADRHEEAQNSSDQQWIQPKSYFKENNRETVEGERAPRAKYNFLEDQNLIERAKKFDPEKEIERRKREKENREKKQDERPSYKNKRQFKEKEEKSESVTYQEKKPKYRVKEEQKKTDEVKVSKPKPKFQEKVDQKEKKQSAQLNLPNSTPEPAATKEYKKEETQITTSQAKSEKKPLQKVVYKIKEDNKTQKFSQPQGQKTNKLEENIQEKKKSQNNTESPKKPAKITDLDPKVAQQFESELKKNAMVLKFILPAQKVQKISYIREPNGNYRGVQVRELLPKKD